MFVDGAIAASVAAAVRAMPALELLAVALAIAYLVLAAREHRACWACAAVSTLIYIGLFWHVSLLMESVLNVYYLAMAGYGWRQWRQSSDGRSLVISTLAVGQHAVLITVIVVLALVSGLLLETHTDAAWPYVDSFTTWGAVVTTWMVTRKILENWIYWFVLDAISIPLYVERGLHLTAMLFATYLVLVVFGFVAWRREYRNGALVAGPA